MRYLILAFICFAIILTSSTVYAQGGGEQIVVIQEKPHLKKFRIEFSALGGWVPSNPFLTYFPVEGRLGLHFSEGFALELGGGWYPPVTKNQINDDLKSYPHYLGARIFEEQVFYANLDMQWTPINGKIRLAGIDSIVYWEIYFQIGAGVTGVHDHERVGPYKDIKKNPLKLRPTFNFGFGNRLWLTNWFALKMDLREYIFQKQVGRGGLSQHTSLLLGFSLII